ncbi:hypothetical protein [Nonomuraea rosea]|uniref:hypothetical protein n=1 Tax=Nonomuraea rosea TaxID=638574 RepID=UPI003CD0AF7A
MTPTAKALRDLRRRVGGAPMRRLFEVLSGPLAQPTTPGAPVRGLPHSLPRRLQLP